jgi:pimeloyl-ACP methyl ester carboxylesterase
MKQGHELTKVYSRRGAQSAILFLHGFTGDADETWDRFPFVLGAEESLSHWDILSLGYHTSFLPGTRGIWSADPELPILATLFGTQLGIPPLSSYSQLAVIAHSMGGLIAQQALVDNPALTKLVRHLFLFGTPSAGLRKAAFITSLLGLLVGDQVHNMASDGDYIRQLRLGWTQRFGQVPPFRFCAIAGDKDQFVPPGSSLQPFARGYQRVVAGDHLSMVKPRNRDADVVRLVVSALTEMPEPQGPSSPLRAAAELGPMAPQGLAIAKAAAAGEQVFTTQPQVVEAALALDRDNKRSDAIALLEKYRHLGTDVVGTLAGRIKRLWLQDGKREDAQWALSLYESALNVNRNLPETQDTIDQIFYHAINVAFLKLVAFDQPAEAKDMAQLALTFARKRAPADVWSLATEAEALLHFGDFEAALDKYQEAKSLKPENWKLLSTGQQAQQVAAKLGRQNLQNKLKTLFDPPPARANKIFVSYSHKDSPWRDELELMLKPLMKGTDRLEFWADNRIQPGADWFKDISNALSSSRVAVLLVSAEFLASDFIRDHELPVILDAVSRGEVILLWIYLSPALYDVSPLAKYQAAHDITKPLERLPKVDQREVLTEVARKIKTAVFM